MVGIVFSDHQAAMVTLRHEYKSEVDNIQVWYDYVNVHCVKASLSDSLLTGYGCVLRTNKDYLFTFERGRLQN